MIALFVIILLRGFRIAHIAPDKAGQLLAAGITMMIGLYAFMNIAVITHLVPTTGLPMPFVSYGGSSLLMNMFGIGILLNIYHQGSSKSKPKRGVSRRKKSAQEFVFGL